MPKYMKNFITLAGLIIVGSFLAFLYSCIAGLADFAARFNPALGPWVFWILFLSVAGMLLWMAAVAFMRPRPMMVYADPSEEDMANFRRELTKRLKKNPVLRDAEVVINTEDDIEAGLAYLKDKADEEIRATARRVFVGTAVSQNGRLDTLVVLFLISRLTWRIAKLYNQRPHHRELVNLYANIAATTFLAGSIEEFGIEEYIHELLGPLASGSAIGAVPGAQAIASAITASVLTGSTNCLLALRCGIVARDYVSLNLDAKGAMRRSATIEASKMFMTMSAETVTYVTKLLVKGGAGAVKSGTAKAVKGVGATFSGAAGSFGDGAKKVGRGVKGTAEAVGESARKVGRGVKDTTETVGASAKKIGHGVKDTVRSATRKAEEARDVARTVAGKAVDAAKEAAHRVVSREKNMAEKAESTLQKGRNAAKKIRERFKELRGGE